MESIVEKIMGYAEKLIDKETEKAIDEKSMTSSPSKSSGKEDFSDKNKDKLVKEVTERFEKLEKSGELEKLAKSFNDSSIIGIGKVKALIHLLKPKELIFLIKAKNDEFLKFLDSLSEEDAYSITERDRLISERLCPQNKIEKSLSKIFYSCLKKIVPGIKKAFNVAGREIKKLQLQVKLARLGSILFGGATRKEDAKEANGVVKILSNSLIATLNPLNHLVPSRKRCFWGLLDKVEDWFENSEAWQRIQLDIKTLWGLIPPRNPLIMSGPGSGMQHFIGGYRQLNPLFRLDELKLYINYLKFYHPKLYRKRVYTLRQDLEAYAPSVRGPAMKLLTDPVEEKSQKNTLVEKANVNAKETPAGLRKLLSDSSSDSKVGNLDKLKTEGKLVDKSKVLKKDLLYRSQNFKNPKELE